MRTNPTGPCQHSLQNVKEILRKLCYTLCFGQEQNSHIRNTSYIHDLLQRNVRYVKFIKIFNFIQRNECAKEK